MSVVNDFTLTDRATSVDAAALLLSIGAPRNPLPTASLGRSVTAHGNVLWSLDHGDNAWTKTFEEPISLVSESSDASLVAVVTIGHTVSLLRGNDGHVLITRKLPPVFESSSSSSLLSSEEDSSTTPSILVTWIERDAHDGTQPGAAKHYSLLLATNVAVEDDHAYDCHLMLVRNLNALDDPSSSSASTERASPKLSTVTVRGYRFGSVAGRDQGDEIRLLGCSIDDASFVSLHWDFATNVMSVRPNPVASDRPHVDSRSGILLQTIQSQAYVMCSTYLETKFRSVEWLVDSSVSASSAASPASTSLQSSCRYDLPTPNSRVTAMETLHCDSSSLAVAVVVVSSATAESTSASDTTILVLQLLVEDTMGLVVLSKPHVLYSIPLQTDVARVELVASPSYPYWFLFKEWSRTDHHQWTAGYKRFNPPPTASLALARLRGLVERGHLDEAARMVRGADGGSDRALLLDDEYSTFVPAEIPLQQLNAVLVWAEQSNELSSAELRSLQRHALELQEDATCAGTDPRGTGIAHLLDAADLLTDLMGSPTVAQAQTLLSIAQQLVGNVDARDFSGRKRDFDERRSAKQRDIQDQLDVAGYLSRLIEKGGADANHVRFDDRFRTIRTIPQLFEALVEQRFFALAELMWHQSNADGQDVLSPHVLVSAIMKISPDAPPQAYSALLEDVVLPQLSINHPYLRTTRSWACRVADRLDETSPSEAGLDSAIHLLEVRFPPLDCPSIAVESGLSHNL
jgi:hypothetical protein